MLKNICTAIISLHAEGIVHRDIKPENLIVDVNQGMKVYLIDFGSAKTLNENKHFKFIKYIDKKYEIDNQPLTKSCTLVGSHKYVSPEIIKGTDLSYQCDCWSMAVLI